MGRATSPISLFSLSRVTMRMAVDAKELWGPSAHPVSPFNAQNDIEKSAMV